MKKLFLVHLGYYDDISDGVYELHTNIFVVANDFISARTIAKANAIVIKNNMHIDGIQLIEKVDGFNVGLSKTDDNDSKIISFKDRKLAKGK